MSMLEKMQTLDPRIKRIKITRNEEGIIGWELYDESDQLLGYGFRLKVPQEGYDMDITEEFDIYDITGIADLDFKVVDLNIEQHEDYTGDLWAADIIEDEFKQQYLGLAAAEIKLAPEGTIDSITDGTISSRMITEAIKVKLVKMAQSMK